MTTDKTLDKAVAEQQRGRILERAANNARRKMCPVCGTWCEFKGYIGTDELRDLACQYNARVYELRELGWEIPRRLKDGAEGNKRYSWYHIVKQTPTQIDLKLGEVYKKIGTVLGWDWYSIKKMKT